MELKELEAMKVAQLREEAAKLEGIENVQQLKKQELIDAICEKLDIQRPEAKSEEPKAEAEGKPEEPEAVEAAAEAKAEAPEAKPEPKPLAKPAKQDEPEAKLTEKKPSPFKGPLKALQAKRNKALADRDHQTLADVRMRIKKYKRKMKKESAAAASSS